MSPQFGVFFHGHIGDAFLQASGPYASAVPPGAPVAIWMRIPSSASLVLSRWKRLGHHGWSFLWKKCQDTIEDEVVFWKEAGILCFFLLNRQKNV